MKKGEFMINTGGLTLKAKIVNGQNRRTSEKLAIAAPKPTQWSIFPVRITIEPSHLNLFPAEGEVIK
jgi:hypothetical protein